MWLEQDETAERPEAKKKGDDIRDSDRHLGPDQATPPDDSEHTVVARE